MNNVNMPVAATGNASPQVIYQAHPDTVNTFKKMREQTGVCKKYTNHYVRVDTLDGQTFEGYIMDMDDHHLYLAGQPSVRYYPYYNPYSPVLPLVLFNLLAITLLN